MPKEDLENVYSKTSFLNMSKRSLSAADFANFDQKGIFYGQAFGDEGGSKISPQ